MTRANLELTVDRLVLDDLPAGQRAAIAAAIEQALARLLDEQGLPPGLGADALYVDTADVRVAAGSGVGAIGSQVAQLVYDHLAGAPPSGVTLAEPQP